MTLQLVSVIDEKDENPALDASLLQSGYRYALSLTHDGAEAEDLLQDACVAVVRRAGRWEKAYLFAVIRNRFIDRYRRNKRILFVSLETNAEAYEITGSWEIPDVIEADKLNRALADLRVEEREALFLAFVAGYTAEQIAGMTRRPRNTVLSLLHRGKQKLRRLLEDIEREVRK